MGTRSTEFSIGEWYHCYTRGIEKRKVFLTKNDRERYMGLLYVCNTPATIHRSDLTSNRDRIFAYPRTDSLVSIGAYCLMPNHVHLLLKEKIEGGISKFMQKLGTAYTMYFNILNNRSGGLFVKPFRAKHIATDDYLQQVIAYIHLNPAALIEPEWKRGRANLKKLHSLLTKYEYSSLPDHERLKRPQNAILNDEIFDISTRTNFNTTLKDARSYYREAFGRESATVKATP
jgi:putative transposase